MMTNFRSQCRYVGRVARWLVTIARSVRIQLLLTTLPAILRVAASLVFIWLSKMLIDLATNPSTPDAKLWGAAALLTGALILEMVFSQTSSYFSTVASTRLSNNLRHRLHAAVINSDIFTDRRHSGDVLERLTTDINTLTNTVVNTLPSIIVMLLQFVAAFVFLGLMNSTLALCAIIITPICMLASKFYILKMRRINKDIRKLESTIHSDIQENVQHRIVVQTLECEESVSENLGTIQKSLYRNMIRRARLSLFSRSAARSGFIAGYLIAFIWSIFELHSGAITFGIMTAFLQLVARIQNPIASLSNTLPSLISTTTSIDRLMEIDITDRLNRGEKIRFAPPAGIRFENVTFRYDNKSRLILKDFSHDFIPGSKTVIMGETGAGKSTLTRLILALLHPIEGRIVIYNSTSSCEVSTATRCNMVYVPQGNSLINGTIRENLLLADADADDSQLREALHTAVADFVFELPDGLDTVCGELGAGLSEGQCQRIAIARALLRKGSVLILDEFNSSLDTETSRKLMERLTESRPNDTIIFISHRQDVVEYCDNIIHIRRL